MGDDNDNVLKFTGSTEVVRPNFFASDAVNLFLDGLSGHSRAELLRFHTMLDNTRQLADTFILLVEAEQERRGQEP
ncbi:hypothetical protein [Phyllobacterium lublinensis]|uniref:hypothetical protein n=1 Tax=Phyllobacterium lublinensis TaxID=2875708 RepID=UPI001CCC6C1D|nr:hypothetical protein [Phyllobacterium sp. 2063]MBZ9655033.1 hypothetical protein [Phyllobacterium sp. 2063]